MNLRHPFKFKLLVDPVTKAVICTIYTNSRVRDFRLFKTIKIRLKKETESLVDKGYQRIGKFHPISDTNIEQLQKKVTSTSASSSRVISLKLRLVYAFLPNYFSECTVDFLQKYLANLIRQVHHALSAGAD